MKPAVGYCLLILLFDFTDGRWESRLSLSGVCMCVCVCARARVCVCVCACVCLCAHVRARARVRVCVCVCMCKPHTVSYYRDFVISDLRRSLA